jgi:class 3 adenylate cyclase
MRRPYRIDGPENDCVQIEDHAEREMTIMFADIDAFASLAETMSPIATFARINEKPRLE